MYDVFGREMAMRMDWKQNVEVRKIGFDGTNISNGVCFHRFSEDNDDDSLTKRVVFIK